MKEMNKINGRTPEEIKKGLEHCSKLIACAGCSYDGDSICDQSMHTDSLALIQQLERERDQYKRERDAAVRDMRDATLCGCHVCKHYYRPDANVRIYACRKFGEFGKFDYIKDDGSMFCGAFEWRGVEVET